MPETAEQKGIICDDVKSAMDAKIASRLGSAAPNSGVGFSGDPFAPLDSLYRMEPVRAKLQQLRNAYIVAQRDGEEPPPLGHFVFVGSPGTGKTSVARVMADILFELGLVGRRHVEETTGLNMTGEYVGQTKKRVEAQLDKAKGGVLFIDEAYNMGKGQFGAEACDTLVAAMTDPQYAGLVIVIAGYAADMDAMLETNAGLKSRFTHTLEFQDWKPDDCVKFFLQKALGKRFSLAEGAEVALASGFEQLVTLSGWGNARDVDAVWKAVQRFRSDRVVQQEDAERSFSTADISQAMQSLIGGRKVAEGKNPTRRPDSAVDLMNQLLAPALHAQGPGKSPQPGTQTRESDMPPREVETSLETQAVATANAVKENIVEECECEPTGGFGGAEAATRDEGVSDEAWAELQQAKEEAQRHEAKVRAEEEERKRIEAAIEAEMQAKRLAKEAYEAKMRELERQRAEAEAKRREQEKIMQKLRQIGNCPAGFQWSKVCGGWRCSAGGHFVTDAQLHANFSHDV